MRALVSDGEADEALRRAHEAAYRLPAGFGGFAATVSCSDGVVTVRGVMRSAGEAELDLTFEPGVDPDGELCAWGRREIGSMVSHRRAQSYEHGDGRYDKTFGAGEDLGGRMVVLAGDPFSSSYRVGEGQITEVHRAMGPTRFSVIIHSRVVAPAGRGLPACFTVHHWAAEGGLARTDVFTDAYVPVDGVMLPERRLVVTAGATGLERRELRFDGHALLEQP